MPQPFTNLVRFKDDSGQVHYGDASPDRLDNLVGSEVDVLDGHPFKGGLKRTGRKALIMTVLSPIDRANVPVIPCVGMNYLAHIIETKNEIPPAPVVFVKPADALAGPYDVITIPSHALLMDYEVELCLIISKDAKNVKAADARDYIFGYTGGNDLSSRHWQRPPFSGGQYCYGKGFDGFAPVGPTILNAQAPGVDPQALDLKLWVNGEQRQSTSTGDMVFDVYKIVEFLSNGATLRQGTVIMTGTPSGIASRRRPEPWLKRDDVVKIRTSRIGTIENKLVGFQTSP